MEVKNQGRLTCPHSFGTCQGHDTNVEVPATPWIPAAPWCASSESGWLWAAGWAWPSRLHFSSKLSLQKGRGLAYWPTKEELSVALTAAKIFRQFLVLACDIYSCNTRNCSLCVYEKEHGTPQTPAVMHSPCSRIWRHSWIWRHSTVHVQHEFLAECNYPQSQMGTITWPLPEQHVTKTAIRKANYTR